MHCTYSCSEAGSLITHMHTGENPFKCDQCNYSSAYAGEVKLHKQRYTGEKPFKCDQCNYSSTQAIHLKVHKRKHTGEKPFKCDQCNYTCTTAGSPKLHKLNHSSSRGCPWLWCEGTRPWWWRGDQTVTWLQPKSMALYECSNQIICNKHILLAQSLWWKAF